MNEQELTDALEQFVKAVSKTVKAPPDQVVEEEAKHNLIAALDRYIDDRISDQLPR